MWQVLRQGIQGVGQLLTWSDVERTMWQQQQQQQQQRALLQDLSGGVRPRGKAEGSAGASTGGRVHIQEDHGGASAWEGQGGPQPTCRPSWRMTPAALLQVGGQCIYYTAKKGERGGKGGGALTFRGGGGGELRSSSRGTLIFRDS